MAKHVDPLPRAYEFFTDTWRIELGGHGCFLLIGGEKAVLVDTGFSTRNLRQFVEETITRLPVIVANTHGHFDHTGGNGWFDEVYMSPYAATEAKRVFEGGDDKRDPADYPLDYEITTIEEGHVFDIGGRRLEAIATPCHSPGSYSYLDLDRRLIFTGDELEAGQILIMRGGSDGVSAAEKFLGNLLKLKEREAEFDYICPAHNGAPIVKAYIDRYIDIARRIIGGEEGMTDVVSATWAGHGHGVDPAWRRINTLGTAGVVYNKDDYK